MEIPLSVTIICKNEEKNIATCLESVKWADEIIVVDAFSSDKTIDIVRKYTDKIFQNHWEGYTAQRKFALSKTSHQWVFSIDADEKCPEELKSEILDAIRHSGEIVGYKIPRKSYFLGKWIKHCGWYPGYQLRLFKKSEAEVTNRLVHEGYEVKGDIGYLKTAIEHYTVNSIADYMNRVNVYSTLQACEKLNRRKVRFGDLFLRPVSSFIRQFFIQRGFLDGVYGLMVTFFDVITNMLTYMKIWEMQNSSKKEL
ncbi:MAG: glycosyltransferase family 2 protein [Ignavibacteria bacterium]